LRAEQYVAYAEYYAAAIDYTVRRQGLRVLAASPMNEPDCGDGSKIAAQDYPTVLKLVADRLRPYGVKLYGPDTCSAENGLAYLEALLADPTALAELDILGVHQYSEGADLARFVRRAREAGLRQSVYVSEFTSFRYGNLDAGDEAGDEIGFTLDALAILRSHLLAGADAALYWDGVDALQEHHGAVTRWGLLRGSSERFEPRTRHAAFRQLLPYLGAGARVLETELTGDSALLPLAVQPPPDLGPGPVVALINPGGPVELSLELSGESAVRALRAFLTDASGGHEHLGEIAIQDRRAELVVPARALLSLVASR
jgi:hypothetical protein